MKIIVLNGSPKGDLSVTMQYVAYIQKRFMADIMTLFTKIPPIRKESPKRIKNGMVKPYQKYLKG
ncbi:MAG: hypothetical protein KAW47_10775 [Thermoplasmatales archaeon]|nr:hypothetical protein [Thermoplasmatales archaeon]